MSVLDDERRQAREDWKQILNAIYRSRYVTQSAEDMGRAIRKEHASDGKKVWVNRPRRVEA